MAPIEGVDYAWGRPGPAALKAAGKEFVIRYLSRDTTGKNLTLSEAAQMTNAGLWVAVVWETSTDRMLGGRAAGVIDAQLADQQARSCGMPEGRPIYFACDFDAAPSQQTLINAYLDGAASVIGLPRVGMYGGYGPIKRALDVGKITYAWQTYAWSAGKWDPRIHVQQYSNGHLINGVDTDLCRAMVEDYGQWMIGVIPGMAITDAELQKIAKAVLDTDNIVQAADGDPANPYWTLKFHVYDMGRNIRALQKTLADAPKLDEEKLAAALATRLRGELMPPPVDVSALVAEVMTALTSRELADLIVENLGPRLAETVMKALRDRLES